MFQPEFALLDIGMPDLNGYEVASIAANVLGQGGASHRAYRLGQEDDKRRAHAAGFDHHLTKPLDPHQLDQLLSESAAD